MQHPIRGPLKHPATSPSKVRGSCPFSCLPFGKQTLATKHQPKFRFLVVNPSEMAARLFLHQFFHIFHIFSICVHPFLHDLPIIFLPFSIENTSTHLRLEAHGQVATVASIKIARAAQRIHCLNRSGTGSGEKSSALGFSHDF